MNANVTAQKGLRTFILTILSGIGVFLTVSAAQYGYQIWTRAQEPSEPVAPAAEVIPTPTRTPAATAPTGSLFESLVEEEPLGVLDYSEFVSSYGKNVPKYDFNENGVVDDEDFETFKRKYQQLNP